MIVTSKCAIKNIGTYLIFTTVHLFVPTIFLSGPCHYLFDMSYNSSHLHTNSIIFHPFLKTITGITPYTQTLEL